MKRITTEFTTEFTAETCRRDDCYFVDYANTPRDPVMFAALPPRLVRCDKHPKCRELIERSGDGDQEGSGQSL